LLAAVFHRCPLRIFILIASRPEVYLQSTFNSSPFQPRLARLALSDDYSAEEDIYRFLEDSFDKIRYEHPLAFYIPSSWPLADVLRELTRKSSGLFIFASTIIRYIGGDPHQLPHRVRQVRPLMGEEDMPHTDSNSLYYPHSPISRTTRWLIWRPGQTKTCPNQLAFSIGYENGHRSIFHASVSEFLLDPFRSRQFYQWRESTIGHCATLGMNHLRNEVSSIYGAPFYLLGTISVNSRC